MECVYKQITRIPEVSYQGRIKEQQNLGTEEHITYFVDGSSSRVL